VSLKGNIGTVLVAAFALSLAMCSASCRSEEVPAPELRERMVRSQIERRGITEPAIVSAFIEVPREEFVLPRYRERAFEDIEIPIGFGESLDRPYDNALMIRALGIGPSSRVLEVGTGVGYLASVMSRIAREVFTIEIDPGMAAAARKNIGRLGYSNVRIKTGDGYAGWPEHAPFDAIVLTTSPPRVPRPLAEQLAEGGRMVIPLGGSKRHQELMLYTKEGKTLKGPVRLAPAEFTPMKGIIKER